ncbi:hypothetical protein PGTUg99_031921 [Puccinia graminis f. sp. tritici]|uniref:Uncharacterized protein n=1 Tax=Puccinia graminis f. sp. tritici TaxID=56615 RepID=A0A5B0RL84_PUCGR|nr:hypothetical protein PGTUg99_031921 [Puccinia graminis f. sp. tritici]
MLIAQELTSAMSWAVKHHGSICPKLDAIARRAVVALNDIGGGDCEVADAEIVNNKSENGSITSINLEECEEAVGSCGTSLGR